MHSHTNLLNSTKGLENEIGSDCCNVCIACLCNVLLWGANHSLSMWNSSHSPPIFIFQARISEVSHWMMWARNCTFLRRNCNSASTPQGLYVPHCKYTYAWSLCACSTPWCSVVNRVTELYCGYGLILKRLILLIGFFEMWMLTDLTYFSLRDFSLGQSWRVSRLPWVRGVTYIYIYIYKKLKYKKVRF